MKYGLFSENVALLSSLCLVLTIHALAQQMKLAFPILFSFHTNGIPYSTTVFLALPVPFLPYIKLLGPIGSRLYCWRGTFSIGIRCPCQDPKLGCTTLIHIVGRKSSTIWLSFLFGSKNGPKVSGTEYDSSWQSSTSDWSVEQKGGLEWNVRKILTQFQSSD